MCGVIVPLDGRDGWDCCCTGVADLDRSAPNEESLCVMEDNDTEELFSAYSLRVGMRPSTACCLTELLCEDDLDEGRNPSCRYDGRPPTSERRRSYLLPLPQQEEEEKLLAANGSEGRWLRL